ncbi:MAG TPA: DUF3090 family protein [Acidimicrobiales bacterium]|nr:DUF3090 family protein [Acidimicrobiales bacterium]
MTVGAIGPPGKRIFYFQARQENQLVSLKLEKDQVLFLAGGLSEVLADLATPASVPSESDLELEEPVEAEWAVGSMQLAYDPIADRVMITAREIASLDEDPGPEELPTDGEPGEAAGAVVRVALTREQAAGVIAHGKVLLRGGRPPCPLCGYPLGEDHSCPKTNGHRSPAL